MHDRGSCIRERIIRAGGVVIGLWAWVALTGCGGGHQAVTYGAAIEKGRRTNQIVLVEFWSLASSDCLRMDQQVFADAGVQQHLNDFVRVRLDYYLNRRLAQELAVGGVPGFATVRPDGTMIASQSGFMDRDALHRFLIRSKVFR